MQDYRAYILGIEGHRFIRAENFLCNHEDDTTALSAARLLTDKHDVEVWDGARLVARLSHGKIISPELAPSFVFASLSEGEKNSIKSVQPISLSKGLELAVAASKPSEDESASHRGTAPSVIRPDSEIALAQPQPA